MKKVKNIAVIKFGRLSNTTEAAGDGERSCLDEPGLSF